MQWKGNYGWIRPHAPIDHPEAGKRNGDLYIHKEDIEGPPPELESLVTFLVYFDSNGLGAMSCRPEAGSLEAAAPGGAAVAGKAWHAPPHTAGRAEGDVSKYQAEGRSRLMPGRVMGVVTEWDGARGTVQLEAPVTHPDFAGGCSEVRLADEEVVPPGSIGEVGAKVTCFVFSDEVGLGAEACVAVKGADWAPPATKRKAWVAVEKPAGVDEDRPPAKVVKPPNGQQSAGKAKGKGKHAQDLGPDLPRERITEIPINGKVLSFNGKVGWIKPDEPLDHPLAAKHQGDIYLHEKDVLEDGDAPEKGKAVNFHVYADKGGLGAEECIVMFH